MGLYGGGKHAFCSILLMNFASNVTIAEGSYAKFKSPRIFSHSSLPLHKLQAMPHVCRSLLEVAVEKDYQACHNCHTVKSELRHFVTAMQTCAYQVHTHELGL